MEKTITATGMVITDQNPKNLLVKNEEWDALLSRFENGTRVIITLTEIDNESAA